MTSAAAPAPVRPEPGLRVPAHERVADLERRLEAWLLIARLVTPRHG